MSRKLLNNGMREPNFYCCEGFSIFVTIYSNRKS
ncbi:MAG: hypothetical protein RIR44_1093, partial [Bacteroidota bacterium]